MDNSFITLSAESNTLTHCQLIQIHCLKKVKKTKQKRKN